MDDLDGEGEGDGVGAAVEDMDVTFVTVLFPVGTTAVVGPVVVALVVAFVVGLTDGVRLGLGVGLGPVVQFTLKQLVCVWFSALPLKHKNFSSGHCIHWQ